ncbi:glycosyltransferase [bacterium]|nr:glycosyltransferase [bacterium]
MNLFIVGIGPLPFEGRKKVYGPSLRTWQFTRACLEKGHKVKLVICDLYDQEDDTKKKILPEQYKHNLEIIALSRNEFQSVTKLQTLLDEYAPDCVIAASSYPSYIASQLKIRVPLWCDFFGHLMAEAQAKTRVYKNPDPIMLARIEIKSILFAADNISAISNRQKFSIIGELGLIGRLNKDTIDYDFVKVIPCSPQFDNPKSQDEKFLRGKIVNEDDFILLWSGGYNTWADVETLFKGLESALNANPRIHFVSAGGEIEGHCGKVYHDLVKLVENSLHKDRYHLLGWLPTDHVLKCWNESNVGVNVDLFTYEGLLGGRNRLVDFLNAGLPIITTRLCELSEAMEEKKIGLTFPVGDDKKLADLILLAYDKPEMLEELSKKGKEFAKRQLANEVISRPLIDWLQDPRLAPDKIAKTHPFFSGKNTQLKTFFMGRAIKIYDIAEKFFLKALLLSDKFIKFCRFCDGKVISFSLHKDITLGKPISAEFELKNTGYLRWNTNFETIHFMLLKCEFIDDTGKSADNNTNAYLPFPVNHGESAKILVDLIPPKKVGDYKILLSLTIPGVGCIPIKIPNSKEIRLSVI